MFRVTNGSKRNFADKSKDVQCGEEKGISVLLGRNVIGRRPASGESSAYFLRNKLAFPIHSSGHPITVCLPPHFVHRNVTRYSGIEKRVVFPQAQRMRRVFCQGSSVAISAIHARWALCRASAASCCGRLRSHSSSRSRSLRILLNSLPTIFHLYSPEGCARVKSECFAAAAPQLKSESTSALQRLAGSRNTRARSYSAGRQRFMRFGLFLWVFLMLPAAAPAQSCGTHTGTNAVAAASCAGAARLGDYT